MFNILEPRSLETLYEHLDKERQQKYKYRTYKIK